MGTSASRTPASTEETAPTRGGRSTAPAWPPTTEKPVSWEPEDSSQTHHSPADQVSRYVGSTPKWAWFGRIGWKTKIVCGCFDYCDISLPAPLSEYSQCPTDGPTACQQVCTAFYHTFRCSCMPGFKLQSDKRSCLPEGLMYQHSDIEPSVQTGWTTCCSSLSGVSLRTSSRNLQQLRVSVSPWELSLAGKVLTWWGKSCKMLWAVWPLQVSVVTSRRVELCEGALLAPSAVLTAASCLHHLDDLQLQNLYVVPGTELHSPNALFLDPEGSCELIVSAMSFCRARQREAVHTRDLCEPPQPLPQRRPRPRPRLPQAGAACEVQPGSHPPLPARQGLLWKSPDAFWDKGNHQETGGSDPGTGVHDPGAVPWPAEHLPPAQQQNVLHEAQRRSGEAGGAFRRILSGGGRKQLKGSEWSHRSEAVQPSAAGNAGCHRRPGNRLPDRAPEVTILRLWRRDGVHQNIPLP